MPLKIYKILNQFAVSMYYLLVIGGVWRLLEIAGRFIAELFGTK